MMCKFEKGLGQSQECSMLASLAKTDFQQICKVKVIPKCLGGGGKLAVSSRVDCPYR